MIIIINFQLTYNFSLCMERNEDLQSDIFIFPLPDIGSDTSLPLTLYLPSKFKFGTRASTVIPFLSKSKLWTERETVVTATALQLQVFCIELNLLSMQ
jgi:hypothetical protein